MVSAKAEPITRSKLEMVSLPTPVAWAVVVARFTVIPLAALRKLRVSKPAPPFSRSLPSPPSMVWSPLPPFSVSPKAEPITPSKVVKTSPVACPPDAVWLARLITTAAFDEA